MSDPKSTCKTCKGRGWGGTYEYKTTCPVCHGTGQAPEKPIKTYEVAPGTYSEAMIEKIRVREDSKQDTGTAQTPDAKPFENASQPTVKPGLKVLFLDVDGVLNSQKTLTRSSRSGSVMGLDPWMCFLVGKIKLDTGCEIVLSSSWRHHPDGVAEVESRLGKLYGKTPTSLSDIRGNEVKAWLDAHPEVTHYAILDDENDFAEDQPLFKTSFAIGLTEEIAQAVTDYLNQEFNQSPEASLNESNLRSQEGSDAI